MENQTPTLNKFQDGLYAVLAANHLIDTPATNRQTLMNLPKTFYAPVKKDNKINLYVVYDIAIIDAVLELYRISQNAYQDIVRGWDNPDCQSEIRKYIITDKIRAPKIYENLNISSPEWQKQERRIIDFIENYFNKKGKINIVAKNKDSYYLLMSVAIRTYLDYLKFDFTELNKYRGDAGKIMTNNTHNRKRDQYIKLYKKVGWVLNYSENIKETAQLWIKSRVLSGVVEVAGNNYTDKSKLLERLRPFDDAMGYHRHAG